MQRYLLAGLAGVLAAAFAVHVVSCTVAADTNYGNPNTLDRRNLPGEGGAAPLSCEGDAAVKFDGGDCPSFATDIYPLLTATGPWQCATATCHGQAQTPLIQGGTPAGCYASLQQITVGGKPYITDAGAKDPNPEGTTTMLCNLQGACGSRMPKPPATDPTPAQLCAIDAWLKCGSPK